jgi:hypothetical protein
MAVLKQIGSEKTDFEDQKLEIEKLTIEKEKLKLEYKRSRWTAISIIVPFLLGIASLVYSVYTSNSTAQLGFQLKATDVIFSARNPEAARLRVEMLKEIFPSQFENNEIFNIRDTSLWSGTETNEIETRKELLQLVTQKAKSTEEIVQVWSKLFPRDRWIDTLKIINKLPSE